MARKLRKIPDGRASAIRFAVVVTYRNGSAAFEAVERITTS
jgi:hypothetical protein